MNFLEWIYKNPFRAFLFLFMSSFGAITSLDVIFGNRLLMEWWSFRLGDPILIPLYGVFASIALSNTDKSIPYPGWKWHIGLLVIGFIMGNFILQNDPLLHVFKNPSDLYHTFSYYFMFMFMGSPILKMVHSKSKWAIITAFLMILGFVGLVLYDINFNFAPNVY